MRIILLGAPGAGKGTQAQFIMKKYGIPLISVGDMLRAAAKSNSNLEEQVKNVINKGKLIADELVTKLVKEKIFQKDCYNGFILDGFPRTIMQANFMKNTGISINYILEFDVPEEISVERITGRLIHANSGRIYHTKFNPPKVEGKDDITGEDLIIRRDDQEEVVRKRLIEYSQLTKPLINYYSKVAQLTNTKYIKIDSTKSVDKIHKDLEKILG